MMNLWRVVNENIQTVLARVKVSQVGLGLHFLPLDRDMWRDVKSVFVNVPEGQTEWPAYGVGHAERGEV